MTSFLAKKKKIIFFSSPGCARELKLLPFVSESKTTSDCSNRFFSKKSPLKVTILPMHKILKRNNFRPFWIRWAYFWKVWRTFFWGVPFDWNLPISLLKLRANLRSLRKRIHCKKIRSICFWWNKKLHKRVSFIPHFFKIDHKKSGISK